MEREPVSGRVHPKVKKRMTEVRMMFKYDGWGAVMEQMAKMLWTAEMTDVIPGSYERDSAKKDVQWKGSKE